MKKFFCCFKGGSSSQVLEDPQPHAQPSDSSDPSESTDSSETINGEDGDLDEQHPIGDLDEQHPLGDLDEQHPLGELEEQQPFGDLGEQLPFGDNEFFNNAWLNNIEIPDDHYPQDSNPNNPHPLSHLTFRWHEILDGTLNLQNTNLLGAGNFGEVYRCDFPRIDKVGAAKIQNLLNPEAQPEFVAEITTLHRADHPNVIKLLGKCINHERRVIVYEFMPKGSLDHYIYADTRPRGGLQQEYAVLNWEMRMKIAVGVAKALIYLHEELKTIHRDVKLSNVLLDEDFEPKLTDFGLATTMVEDENGVEQQSVIDPIKGTPGCIAPETQVFGVVSSKSDIYSYGVFLCTLFTGRRAYDQEKPPGSRKISDWLMPIWDREEYMPLVVDVALANRFSVEGLTRLFQAARMCINPHVLVRPNMRVVEFMVREAADFEVPECPSVTRRHSM